MPEETRTGTQRVLLIDDDESIAGSLHQYLLTQGCEVDVAVDTASAERLMAAQQYDVVVVDPYLTGGVAHEAGVLLSMIRSRQPVGALIVLTAYDSSTLVISAEREHATAVLTKPQPVVSLGELVVGASAGAFPALQPTNAAQRMTE